MGKSTCNHKPSCAQPKARYILKADVEVEGPGLCTPCKKPKLRVDKVYLVKADDCSSSSSSGEWEHKKKDHKKKEHKHSTQY